MKLLIHLILAGLAVYSESFGQDLFPARQLTSGPEQKGFPSWSPDSEKLVHQISSRNDTQGKNGLHIIDPDGKISSLIFKGIAEHPRWSPDGNLIVFDADTGKAVNLIQATGGKPYRFLPDSVVIGNGGLPCWSPDGSEIAFVESDGPSLCTFSLRTGKLERLFSQEGKVPLPGCWWNDGSSILFALMDIATRRSEIKRIYISDRKVEDIPCDNEYFYRHLELSPDGSLLIFAALEGRSLGLHIMSSGGGRSIPFAVSENAHNEAARWSPDGRRVAFNSTRSGSFDIWIMDVNIDKIKSELSSK